MEKTGDLKFRSEWTRFRFTQGSVSSGFTVYVDALMQRAENVVLKDIFNIK